MIKNRLKCKSAYARKVLTLFAVFFISSFTTFAQSLTQLPRQTIDNQEFYIYEVTAAEGFYAISRKFNVSQQEIEKYNPETSNGIKLGQRLLIPVDPVQPALPVKLEAHPSSANSFTHTVIKGETLHGISRMYHVTIDQIKALNPGLTDNLRLGTALEIPQATQQATAQGLYTYHTIEPKDTLYGLAKKYNVTMQHILDENPGLSQLNFSIGKIVRIKADSKPQTSQNSTYNAEETTYDVRLYKVRRKETYASVAKKFGIKEQALRKQNPGFKTLRSGNRIEIPIPRKRKVEATVVVTESNNDSIARMNEILAEAGEISKTGQVKLAVLLPLDSQNKDPKAIKQNRYLEFYEGLLLAVDSLNTLGTQIELFVYDTHNNPIFQILNLPELKTVDLIIGPAAKDQINPVAQFAKINKINMVNPFSFDSQATESNPYLFQLNTPTSFLNAESTDEFIRLFKNHRIVFLKQKGLVTDKKDFITYLRHELQLQNIAFDDYEYSTAQELTNVDTLLDLDGETVFVPLSAKKEALYTILPSLTIIDNSNDNIEISLFGYPEWQMHTNEFMDYFYNLNTYIYTRIYVNPFGRETTEFYQKYAKWFQKELLPSYPRYGMLGFDTGMYFIQAVKQYGKNFDAHIQMMPSKSIQTAMCFRRINNWGGFINRCIYFVNFTPNATIEKIEVQ